MRRDAGTSACSRPPEPGPLCARVRQSTPAVPSVQSWELSSSSSSSFDDLARERVFSFEPRITNLAISRSCSYRVAFFTIPRRMNE